MALQHGVPAHLRTLLLFLGLNTVVQVTAICQDPLGMEDGRIADSQITASSEFAYSTYHGASNARLNRPAQTGTTGSWSAQTNDANQWIQANLGVSTWVTGVMIQGRANYAPGQWVTKFKVQYSDDGNYWKYVQKTNNQGEMVYDGNTDQDAVVTGLFATPVQATFIRIRPTQWQSHISMRFEVVGCGASICQEFLGMEDGRIEDSHITASTEFAHSTYYGADNARLNRPAQTGTTGSWSAQTNDANQWIQANLGVSTWVTGVMIQGRADYPPGQWVIKFKVQYGEDGEYWKYVETDNNQGEKVFDGSTDQDRAVLALFASPVRASFIRIRPIVWNGHISMRFEVLGCSC